MSCIRIYERELKLLIVSTTLANWKMYQSYCLSTGLGLTCPHFPPSQTDHVARHSVGDRWIPHHGTCYFTLMPRQCSEPMQSPKCICHRCSHLLSMRIGVANDAGCLVTAIEVNLVAPYLSMVSKCLFSDSVYIPVHNPRSNEKWCIGTGCCTEEWFITTDELLCNQEQNALGHLASRRQSEINQQDRWTVMLRPSVFTIRSFSNSF
jgi:hypothetical protein